MSIINDFSKGIIRENTVFRLVLGLCPTLATTTVAAGGLGMGLSSTAVLACSNLVVSLLRNVIPSKIRIPCFIIIIATFVTIVDMMLNAFQPELHAQLGIFVPLIVVNCMILGRAEAFASKNPVINSVADGLGIGLGFTLSLTVLASVRELLSKGTIFSYNILGASYEPFQIFGFPAGAFIALGLMMAVVNLLTNQRRQE